MKTHKLCPTCKVERPTDQFHKNKKRKDGLASWCKPCSKVWRDKNKDVLYKHSRKQDSYAPKHKQTLVEMKGGACIDCGHKSKHYCVYDFHHRDPATKKFAVSTMLTKTGAGISQAILDEVEKCDLLCANCHRIRHSGKGAKPKCQGGDRSQEKKRA